jgi:hypothetical protein
MVILSHSTVAWILDCADGISQRRHVSLPKLYPAPSCGQWTAYPTPHAAPLVEVCIIVNLMIEEPVK